MIDQKHWNIKKRESLAYSLTKLTEQFSNVKFH